MGYAFDIAFFWTGQDTSIPSCLVASARAAFGQIVIHQLTDHATPAVEGADAVHRRESPPAIMLARSSAMAAFPLARPTLFLDADMVVLNRFELPEFGENEILTVGRERDGKISRQMSSLYPEFSGRMLNEEMPFLGCLVGCRSGLFLKLVSARLTTYADSYKQWFGDQIALRDVLQSGSFKPKALDASEFAKQVDASTTGDQIECYRSSGVKIVHAKGQTFDKLEICRRALPKKSFVTV